MPSSGSRLPQRLKNRARKSFCGDAIGKLLVPLLAVALFLAFGCVNLDIFNSNPPAAQGSNESEDAQLPPQMPDFGEQAGEESIPQPPDAVLQEPVCGNGQLEGGEACEPGANACPDGQYCSACKCYAAAEPISCAENHVSVQETGANEFVFTTLPACGDDCLGLLGPDYKCDLRTCTCVPRETKPSEAKPICGNGIVEAGEKCDGSSRGSCALSEYCSTSCACVGSQTEDFRIAEVFGLKAEYNAGETVEMRLTGVEANGSFASRKGGFRVQAHAFDSPASAVFSAADGDYQDGGYWRLLVKIPDTTGKYEWKLSLFCSSNNSHCSEAYGVGKQVDYRAQFSVKAACTDADGLDRYSKGTATGASPANGSFITVEDKCADLYTVAESHCDGTKLLTSLLNCQYGCYQGKCSKGDSPFKITTGSLPNARTAIRYCVYLGATGGLEPYENWSVVSGYLPEGMKLDYETGELCGTSLHPQARSFEVSVSDSGGHTAQKSLQIVVEN